MNRSVVLLPVCAALVAAAGCSSNKAKDEPAPAATSSSTVSTLAKPLSVEESANATIKAYVKAVDYATREVTLDDYKGHEIAVIVGPGVQRFSEVKVGDQVTVDYAVKLLAELRPPTQDERDHPIQMVGVTGRMNKPADPAGAAARGFKVVTTVQMIDIPNMLVTLQGPMGDRATVKAKKAENLQKMHVGDTIVITYAEGLAMSLRKDGW